MDNACLIEGHEWFELALRKALNCLAGDMAQSFREEKPQDYQNFVIEDKKFNYSQKK